MRDASCRSRLRSGLSIPTLRDFFSSGHIDTQKIIDIYDRQGYYIIPLHEFLRTIIYGDNIHFDPDSSIVANLFDISHFDTREHFIIPLLIGFLHTATGPGVEEGFVETQLVYEGLQNIGYTPDQIDAAVIKAHRKKLIESSARRIPQPGHSMPNALRATTVGIYHITRLCEQFTYLDAITVDLPIFDNTKRVYIKDVSYIDERLQRAEHICEYLKDAWGFPDDITMLFDWPNIIQSLTNEIQRIKNIRDRNR